MNRQQGLQLVEFFFGARKLDYRDHQRDMVFEIPTKAGTFNLLNLLKDYPTIDLNEFYDKFGEDADPLKLKLLDNMDPQFLKYWEEQYKDYDIKYAKPILDLLNSPLTTMECRIIINTLLRNEAIKENYRLRIDSWNNMTRILPQLIIDDGIHKTMVNAGLVPWLVGIGNQPNPLRFYNQFNTKSDREKLNLMVEMIQDAANYYTRFHQGHFDVLESIVGDKDFTGNDWEGVANEQTRLFIAALNESKNQLEAQSADIPKWIQLSLDYGLLIDNGNYYYPRRSMADLKRQLKTISNINNISEPKAEEIHEKIMKKYGTQYNLKSVRNA